MKFLLSGIIDNVWAELVIKKFPMIPHLPTPNLLCQCLVSVICLSRLLPSPPVPSMHHNDAVELIDGIQHQWNVTILSDDQVLTYNTYFK